MTTMADLIADTRRIAYGSMSDQLVFLSEEAPADATELFLTSSIDSISPGMILSSGLNVWYVVSTETSRKRVVVYPNYDNSRSDLVAAGAAVMVRPRVTDWLLFTYLNDVVRSLSSPSVGLYCEGSWTDDAPGVWNDYAIPVAAQDMISLIRVSVQEFGGDDGWWVVPPNSVKWQPEHDVIRLTTLNLTGRTVKFDYKGPFVAAAGLTDDVETDMGLAATMTDLPPLGAAVRLLRTTESRRQQIHAQPDPRRADEVQAGANTSAARDFAREFASRIDDEYTRLVNRNPYMRQL